MMAHGHATTSLLAGAATLPLAHALGVDAPAEQIAWVTVWAGAGLLPDFDQAGTSWRDGFPSPTGSTVVSMWGWLTWAPAKVVGRIAGGHRWGTHDPIVGPAAVYVLAVLASLNRWTAMAVLAFAIGATLRALHFVIPGRIETTVVGNLVLSWAAAWLLTTRPAVDLTWLPVALAGGALAHIAGDFLTEGGVPRPGAYLLGLVRGSRRRWALGLFATGSRRGALVEGCIAAVAFLGAVYLTAHHLGYAPSNPLELIA